MTRLLATLLWVPLITITALIAFTGGALVMLAACLTPCVRWLAAKGDGG